MDGVSFGNVTHVFKNGWFVGHFFGDDPIRQTNDVAVKWGIHPAGQSNGKLSAYRTATTISVLVRGRFRLTFKHRDNEEQVLLQHEGDYIIFNPGVYHTWIAEADTVIMSVRWPSVGPADQVVLDQ